MSFHNNQFCRRINGTTNQKKGNIEPKVVNVELKNLIQKGLKNKLKKDIENCRYPYQLKRNKIQLKEFK